MRANVTVSHERWPLSRRWEAHSAGGRAEEARSSPEKSSALGRHYQSKLHHCLQLSLIRCLTMPESCSRRKALCRSLLLRRLLLVRKRLVQH